MADVAQHMAEKRYFCKLDCSQAYHGLQMTDEQSVQLLAFNFGSRAFGFLRLAQGLNRSLSAFNITFREYLDPWSRQTIAPNLLTISALQPTLSKN